MTDVDTHVTPSAALDAIRFYREAINQIRLLRRSAFPRWSDGMTAWFADERPPDDREEFLLYDERELAIYRIARENLSESIRLNPYNPDAYILLGNACHEIDGDLSSMLSHYNTAIDLDPDNDEFYNCRMSHYINTNNLDAALIDLEHLERLQSGYAASKREHYEKAKNRG
jgi:tetratricopeptide (TPR) repeat protein